MRQVTQRVATAALLALVAACQPMGSGSGQIGMRVQFPRMFQTQAIPATTASIQVTVSGQGLTGPRTATLTPQAPSLLMTVPEGPKTIQAIAFDADNQRVAQGSASISVIAHGKVTAVVTLSSEPEPSPSASPSGPPTPGPSGPPATPPPPSPSAGPTVAPPLPTANTLQPTGGAGGGVLATPTPTPTPDASTAPVGLTVNDGQPAPAPGAQDL